MHTLTEAETKIVLAALKLLSNDTLERYRVQERKGKGQILGAELEQITALRLRLGDDEV